MKVTNLEPFPPKSNPFQCDSFHMGVVIGTNCTVMMSNHEDKECAYLIVINTDTGERVRVDITSDGEAQATFSEKVDKIWRTPLNFFLKTNGLPDK